MRRSLSVLKVGRSSLYLTTVFVLLMVVCALSWVTSGPGKTAHAEPVKVGLIFNSPLGAGDYGYNWLANEGLNRAVSDLGVVGKTYTPNTQDEYGPLLNQCVMDGNILCLSVGWEMSDTTWDAAVIYPAIDFAIVDYSWDNQPQNLRGMVFASDQVGYLAGTLAGLMTQSDVVGVIGGMQIPTVTALVEPYQIGAQCANSGAHILVDYANNFFDPELGAQLAQTQMALGADVIFSAAGPTGDGAILEAAQTGKWAIGVDTDQWYNAFNSGVVTGSEKLLSSAMKRVDNAVYDTISDEVTGTFTGGVVGYDLAVGGVGLAPFHDADLSIPQPVKDQLVAVQNDIIDGDIDVWHSCRPFIYLPVISR